ncbi:MAG TPA: hypothetical protein VEQ59_00735, partial [Polyangiaceae bacterium]|nr:hypothetical protein [Polyangiaceae bacterium]
MRWFVEVSRVGDDSSDERYCVEAKQWQAALQEARKLRGDSGPLSKFSIELLDDGYRAVDPRQKLRFVVAKAPPNAELTTEPTLGDAQRRVGQSASVPAPTRSGPSFPAPGSTGHSAAPSAALASVAPVAATAIAHSVPAPAVVASVPAPVEVVASVPAPAVVASVPAPVEIVAPPPAAAEAAPNVTAPANIEPAAVAAPAFLPAHAEPYAGVPSSDLSPNAPPLGVSSPPPIALAPAILAGDAIPAAPALPRGLGPAVALPQQFTQPSAAIDVPPPATVLRRRQEEPTAESPITYREIAYVVDPGVSRGAIEALLWASFRDLSRELADVQGQKFVQLAVFDHHFDKRPERAPL